jgi:hypothetical protein
MPIPTRWLREPLLHFMLAGAILFTAYTLIRGDEAASSDATTITVGRRELLTFLQYRANAFEPETFGAALDAMSDADLADVIDAYVDEEILYREARGLGLEESDNIIRQRMVQKMNFLLADVAAAGQGPDEAALEAYFEANKEAYAIQPWATFTHVFFDVTKHGGEDGAREAAEAAKRELNAAGAGFNDATDLGDRFPFLRNYVERTFEYIASHFGYEFAASLEALEPSDQWQGPISSVYGEHVVLLTRSEKRAYPELEDVRADVERDFASEQANAAKAEMLDAIRGRYHIEIGEIRSGTDE